MNQCGFSTLTCCPNRGEKEEVVKLSEKRQSELYAAISEPIMDTRIKNRKQAIDVDLELFNLERRIWRKVHKVLNLANPA